MTASLQVLHLQLHAVACAAKLRKAVDQYFLIGVTGLQSGGKSTLTEKIIERQVLLCNFPAAIDLACNMQVAANGFGLH